METSASFEARSAPSLYPTGKIETIEVFWDIDDALQWLDEQMAKGRGDTQR